MKIAHYDADTKRLLGWYSEDINDNIPEPNILVSEEIWQSLLNKQVCIEDGTAKEYIPTIEEEAFFDKSLKIYEAKQYLSETDFKMLPDYTTRPDGEPIEDIKAKRSAARELIRQMEQ